MPTQKDLAASGLERQPQPEDQSTGFQAPHIKSSPSEQVGEKVDNTRGLTDRSLPSPELQKEIAKYKSFKDLAPDSDKSYGEILLHLYNVAQDRPGTATQDTRLHQHRDRGQDIRAILPTLAEDKRLITALNKLAHSDSLFGQTLPENATKEKKEAFERLRIEFMVDLLAAAANPSTINQGPGAMCTAACTLKRLDAADLIKIATDYAVEGRARTPSGKLMYAQDYFAERSITEAAGNLSDLRSIRPSAGMLNLLHGVMSLGIPDMRTQTGSYWHQYTDAFRHLTGKDVAWGKPEGEVYLDNQGKPVTSKVHAARTLTTVEYLFEQLAARKQDHSGPGILIDTEFSHRGVAGVQDGLHQRHALLAKGLQTINGRQCVVFENPIGRYINSETGNYFPEGTFLGDPKSFWFLTGPGNTIYVQADVLKKHLRGVVVEYDKIFTVKDTSPPRALGDVTTEATQEIPFIIASEHAAEAFHPDKLKGDTDQPRMRERPFATAESYVPSHSKDQDVGPRSKGGRIKHPRELLEEEQGAYDNAFKEFSQIPQKSVPHVTENERRHLERLGRSEPKVDYKPSHFDKSQPDKGTSVTGSAMVWGANPSAAYKPKK